VSADLSKRWVLDSIERHSVRAGWREVSAGPGGLVAAGDGALVLMAHVRFPAHIGVWLQPEERIIHCSEQHGVCCESVLAVCQMGWKKLTFYELASGRRSSRLIVKDTLMLQAVRSPLVTSIPKWVSSR
jgi:hypothetical protein